MTWLFWTFGGVIALAGLLLAVRALFADRPRGRLRCPKCWYDMSGLKVGDGPLTCPECGRTQKDDRRLRKTRRRYPLAVLGTATIVIGAAAAFAPRIISGDRLSFAPTFAMRLAMRGLEKDARAEYAKRTGPATLPTVYTPALNPRIGGSAAVEDAEKWKDHLAAWGAVLVLREAADAPRRTPGNVRMSPYMQALSCLKQIGSESRIARSEVAALVRNRNAATWVRSLALEVLGAHPDAHACSVVRGTFRDAMAPASLREESLQMMRLLQWRRDRDASVLEAVVLDSTASNPFRRSALVVLTTLSERARRGPLERLFRSSDVPVQIRLDALDALGPVDSVGEPLSQILAEASAPPAERAARVLVERVSTPEAVERLLIAMESDHPPARSGALAGFEILGPRAAVAVKRLERVAWIEGDRHETRAIRSLLAIGEPATEAVQRVAVHALASHDPIVQLQMARLLRVWRVRDQQVASALFDVQPSDLRLDLSYAVLVAIARISPDPALTIDKAIASIDDPYPPTRYFAAYTLGETADASHDEAISALRRVPQDGRPEAREAARALAKLGAALLTTGTPESEPDRALEGPLNRPLESEPEAEPPP